MQNISALNFSALLCEWEEYIRIGKIEAVRTEFDQYKFDKQTYRLPRSLNISFAAVFRRAEMTEEAVRLLRPIVYGEREQPASDLEIIEYCHALKKLGLANESFNRLIRIDPSRTPAVLLNQAYYHMGRWNYEAALPLIERYLSTPHLEPYQIAVSQANLASCYLETSDLKACLKIIDSLEESCQKNGWTKLLYNCFEMKIDVFIQQKNFTSAEKILLHADQSSLSNQTRDFFFFEKKKAVLAACKTNEINELEKIRQLSLSRGLWESARDIDFHIALISRNQSLIDKLYHGTPHFGFQKKLEKHFSFISEHYKLNGDQPRAFSLSSGKENERRIIKPGQVVHKLLYALVSDFYRPIDRGVIFNAVFPGEDFDYETSVNRVHQAILRARTWLQKQNIPIELTNVEDIYSLKFIGPYTVIKDRGIQLMDEDSLLFENLLKCFPDCKFTVHEACEALQLSRAKMNRALKALVDSQKLSKTGAGRAIRYIARNEK